MSYQTIYQTLLKRPALLALFFYAFFLMLVLKVFPSAGERIFRLEEKGELCRAALEAQMNEGGVCGSIVEAAEREENFRYTLVLSGPVLEGKKLQLYFDQELAVGTQVLVCGEVTYAYPPTNPGEWDALSYQRIQGIAGSVFSPRSVEILSDQRVSPFLWWARLVSDSKKLFARNLQKIYRDEYGILFSAALFGYREEGFSELYETFRGRGIAHLLAISGLHLSIVASFLQRLLGKRLPKQKAQLMVTLGLWLYGLFCGLSFSILRACLMESLSLMALLFGREKDRLSIGALSGLILLLIQPLYLFQSSFWYTYSALAGIYFSYLFTGLLAKSPFPYLKYLGVPVSVGFFTLPVSAYYSYHIAPLSFLINAFAIPMFSLLMPLAFLSLLLSLLHPSLGQGVALLAEGMARVLLAGSSGASSIWGSVSVGRPSLLLLLLYYSLLGGLWGYLFIRDRMLKRAFLRRFLKGEAILLGLSLIIGLYQFFSLRITFLDVGQGDCCVIEYRGKCVIIDGGGSYEQKLQPYLFYRGIRRIDLLILSHPDLDHISALLELSQDPLIRVETLICSRASSNQTENLQLLSARIQERGGSVRFAAGGDRVSVEDLSIRFLSPTRFYEDTNQDSLVALLSREPLEVLFLGDISDYVERRLYHEFAPSAPVRILKAAHHGSRFASDEAFLAYYEPTFTLISCGRNNRYNHPHPETVARYRAQSLSLATTAGRGAVTISVPPFGDKPYYAYFYEGKEPWENPSKNK